MSNGERLGDPPTMERHTEIHRRAVGGVGRWAVIDQSDQAGADDVCVKARPSFSILSGTRRPRSLGTQQGETRDTNKNCTVPFCHTSAQHGRHLQTSCRLLARLPRTACRLSNNAPTAKPDTMQALAPNDQSHGIEKRSCRPAKNKGPRSGE